MLHTERLFLRKFTIEDAPFILELVNTPGWLQFIGDRGIRTLEAAKDYLANILIDGYQKFGFGFYAMQLKEGNIPIGTCGLIKRDGLDEIDMGFALLPTYFGMGYGYEASLAILTYAQKDLNLKKILAIANNDNIRSIKLLEKLGFQFEKMIKLPQEVKEIKLFEKSLI